jgi:hypothetical protein
VRKLRAARSGTTRENAEVLCLRSYTIASPSTAPTTAVVFHFQLKLKSLDLDACTKLGSWTLSRLAGGGGGGGGGLLCSRCEMFAMAVPAHTEGNMGCHPARADSSAFVYYCVFMPCYLTYFVMRFT